MRPPFRLLYSKGVTVDHGNHSFSYLNVGHHHIATSRIAKLTCLYFSNHRQGKNVQEVGNLRFKGRVVPCPVVRLYLFFLFVLVLLLQDKRNKANYQCARRSVNYHTMPLRQPYGPYRDRSRRGRNGVCTRQSVAIMPGAPPAFHAQCSGAISRHLANAQCPCRGAKGRSGGRCGNDGARSGLTNEFYPLVNEQIRRPPVRFARNLRREMALNPAIRLSDM